jgi:hypothetical protein
LLHGGCDGLSGKVLQILLPVQHSGKCAFKLKRYSLRQEDATQFFNELLCVHKKTLSSSGEKGRFTENVPKAKRFATFHLRVPSHVIAIRNYGSICVLCNLKSIPTLCKIT